MRTRGRVHFPRAARTARLALHLTRRPVDVVDLRAGARTATSSPLDLGVPWFSYRAIRFLDDFLTPEMRVLEFGSGGSTVFFARRVQRTVSIENDPSWHDRLSRRLDELGLGNVELIHAHADLDSPEGFRSSPFMNAHSGEPADVVVVDSCDYRTYELRPVAVDVARHLVKPGGVLVLDDYSRYKRTVADLPGWERTVFKGPGPARRDLTSTAVFRRVASE